MELVLSLFPGVDLLGRAFEHCDFCVVRGPDTILDLRIEDFRTPAGRFDGVIGGPPCQHYSDANRTRNPEEGDRLVRHFMRVVDKSRPGWFLMENVRNVPNVSLPGYHVQRLDITDCECGGKQKRRGHIRTLTLLEGSQPGTVTDRRCIVCGGSGKLIHECLKCAGSGRERVPGSEIADVIRWAASL